MKDRLPIISIKVDVSAAEFLHRMEATARKVGEYIVEVQPAIGAVATPQIKLTPLIVSEHIGLSGWLRTDDEVDDRVCAGVVATRWNPDPPTYGIYAQAVHEVFGSLMHAYNRDYGTNRRLNIPSREETEPHLPEKAREMFYEFVALADKNGLNEEDWSRLYGLIWHCTTYNVEINIPDLDRLLRLAGFEDDHANRVAIIFNEGRLMLLHKWRGITTEEKGRP